MAISSFKVMLLQNGRTQKDIANEIGSHQSHVSDWLNARKTPNSSSLYKLAKSLGITPEELINQLKSIKKEYDTINKNENQENKPNIWG